MYSVVIGVSWVPFVLKLLTPFQINKFGYYHLTDIVFWFWTSLLSDCLQYKAHRFVIKFSAFDYQDFRQSISKPVAVQTTFLHLTIHDQQDEYLGRTNRFWSSQALQYISVVSENVIDILLKRNYNFLSCSCPDSAKNHIRNGDKHCDVTCLCDIFSSAIVVV